MTETPLAPPSGWIILDKPHGLGSTQAVAAVKRNLREAGYGKKVRVGHGGTLDPLATGVLPIAVGEATKLAGRMLDASKEYAFTVRFGAETDTLDLEGKVVGSQHLDPLNVDAACSEPLQGVASRGYIDRVEVIDHDHEVRVADVGHHTACVRVDLAQRHHAHRCRRHRRRSMRLMAMDGPHARPRHHRERARSHHASADNLVDHAAQAIAADLGN